MTFKIYKSEYNPSNLTDQVGGDISTLELSGYIDELFYDISVNPGDSTVVYQYRKVFVKNEYETQSTNTRIWIDALEHEDQVSLALEGSASDVSSSPTGQPAGVTSWTLPRNYAEGIDLGSISANSYAGVWVRQSLSGLISPDPYASLEFTLAE